MSNKYTYCVPFTEEELFDCYVTQQMSQEEIATKFSTTQKVVWRAMQKMNIPTRKAVKRNQLGEYNSHWKGGRVLQGANVGATRFTDGGYWYIRKPDHPNAHRGGYVAEHILIVTEIEGRPLVKGEMVHHIDLDKHHNTSDNLVICDSKQHREYHLQLEMIAVQLYRQGLVVFDKTKGYSLIERESDAK